MLHTQNSGGPRSSANERKSKPRSVEVDFVQDRTLREVVQAIEEAKKRDDFTWSWLSEQSKEVSTASTYAWRSGKTKGVFFRRVNAILKPLGLRVRVEKIR